MGKQEILYPCFCNLCARNTEKGYSHVPKRTRTRHEGKDPKALEKRNSYSGVLDLGK